MENQHFKKAPTGRVNGAIDGLEMTLFPQRKIDGGLKRVHTADLFGELLISAEISATKDARTRAVTIPISH